MLTLISAMVFLSPQASVTQPFANHRLFCPPGIACHGPKAMLPVRVTPRDSAGPIQLPQAGKPRQVKHY